MTSETATRSDQTLGMLSKQLGIDTGLVVITIEVGLGGELHQVLVADFILGEHGHVVALVLASGKSIESRSGVR